MRKIYLALIIVLAGYQYTYAQWVQNGSNIYNLGNVGIGITSPETNLEINNGSYANDNQLIISGAEFDRYYGVIGEFVSTGQTVFSFGTKSNYINYFRTLNLLNGTVGIGTTSPQSNLEINNGSYANGNQLIVSGAEPTRYYGVIETTVQTGQTTFSLGTKSNYINYFGTLNLYNGNVGIGIISPQNKLDVNGTIHSKQVNVDMTGWGDFVFNKDYNLPTLKEVKTYIDQNHHLPEIPSEQEVIKDGLNLGEMNKLLVKKVEELTLYMIQKDNQVNTLQNEMSQQQKANQTQQEQIAELKKQVEALMQLSNKK